MIDDTVAWNWYYDHPKHVNDIWNAAPCAIEPTGEDRNRPELWKGIHWKWFFETKRKKQS